MQLAEAEEQQAAERPSTSGKHTIDDMPEQRWDCESVLSLRSNLDNHPGTILEQPRRRYQPAQGKIKLAAKTGQLQQGCFVDFLCVKVYILTRRPEVQILAHALY